MQLRIFGKHTMIYALGLFAERCIGLLLTPLYTRTLSITDYGLLLTLFVTVEILSVFIGGELKSAFIRFYYDAESKGKAGSLLGTSIFLNIIGCIMFSTFILLIMPSLFEKTRISKESFSLLFIVCLLAVCVSIYRLTISYFRASNKASKYTIFNILVALSTLFLTVLILCQWNGGVKGAIYARIISYMIFSLAMLIMVSKKIKISFSKVYVSQLLRFGIPLVVAASAWFVIEASDRYFLAYYAGLDVVGFYGLGYQVASILVLMVVMPFQLAFGPYTFSILEKTDAKKKIAQLLYFLILSLFVAGIGLIVGAPLLLSILAPSEYGQAYNVVLCILPAAAMIGIYYWGSALIHIAKKTQLIAFITSIAAILNIFLNYLFIPQFGWIGAAISTNLSFLFAAIGICILGMRLFPVPILSQGRMFPTLVLKYIQLFVNSTFLKVSNVLNKRI